MFSAETSAPGRTKWLWLLALILCWEAVRRLFGVSPLLMPPVTSVAAEFVRGLLGGELLRRWLRSLLVVFAGMGAGVVLAMLFLLLSGSGRAGAALCALLSSILHPLPGLALLPLVILALGTGPAAVLAIIIHAVLWPVFVNLDSGFRSQEPSWGLYARILNLKARTVFFRIALPGSFPHFIAGIRIAWARSWRAFIAAEMVFGAVSGSGGLGWQLFESRVMMDTEAMYAAMLAVMLTGVFMDEAVLNRWEKKVRSRWEGASV